jgi:hypothetical protein
MNGNTAAVIDITPDAREAAALALPIPDQAKALKIVDDATLKAGNELLLNIKDLRKKIQDTFRPICEAAHDAHRRAVAAQKDAEAPLIEAEGIVKPAISRYVAEEDRKRREAEEAARKEADRIAQEEALKAAVAAEEAGATPEEVNAIAETPAFIPVVPPPPAPKLSGVSIRKVAKFEVVNFRALVQAVAAGQVPIEALQPNDTVIGQQARSLRTSLRWPGVRVWEEDSVAAGRR